jgi:nucleoside-diphosphate-sugar epimerase
MLTVIPVMKKRMGQPMFVQEKVTSHCIIIKFNKSFTMKVLVTGGAGFLGLHIARYFVRQKWNVVLYDIADYAKEEYPQGCTFLKGNVQDIKALELSLKSVDAVIHAAAALPLRSAEEIMKTNIEGTRNVLEACLEQNVNRIVYISSTAVYGVPEKHPVYEDDPMVGVGPYGESKIAAEKLCRLYRKKGLTISVIRPKTFVGTHRLGVFEILFDWIKDNKKIPVIGSGRNQYQLLEVDDLVSAIYLTVTGPKDKVNTVFNVGAERFKTVKEDLENMFRAVGSHSKVLTTPAFPIKIALYIFEQLKLSPLYKWVYATADKDSFVSIERIKKIGWKPKHSNTDALIKAYRWYEEHYAEIKSRPAGTTHTVGWKQGILGLFKKFM